MEYNKIEWVLIQIAKITSILIQIEQIIQNKQKTKFGKMRSSRKQSEQYKSETNPAVNQASIVLHLNAQKKSILNTVLKQLQSTREDPRLHLLILDHIYAGKIKEIERLLPQGDFQILMKKIEGLNNDQTSKFRKKKQDLNMSMEQSQDLESLRGSVMLKKISMMKNNESNFYRQRNTTSRNNTSQQLSLASLNSTISFEAKTTNFRQTKKSFYKSQTRQIQQQQQIQLLHIGNQREKINRAIILNPKQDNNFMNETSKSNVYLRDRNFDARQQPQQNINTAKRQVYFYSPTEGQHALQFHLDPERTIYSQLSEIQRQIGQVNIELYCKFKNNQKLESLQTMKYQRISHIERVYFPIQKIVVKEKQQLFTKTNLKQKQNQQQANTIQCQIYEKCYQTNTMNKLDDRLLFRVQSQKQTILDLKNRIFVMMEPNFKIVKLFVKVFGDQQRTKEYLNHDLLLGRIQDKKRIVVYVEVPKSLEFYGFINGFSLKITHEDYQKTIKPEKPGKLKKDLIQSFRDEKKFRDFVIYRLFLPSIKRGQSLKPLIEWVINEIHSEYDGYIWKSQQNRTQFNQNFIFYYLLTKSENEVKYLMMKKMCGNKLPIPIYLTDVSFESYKKLIKNQQLEYIVNEGVTIVSVGMPQQRQNNYGKSYFLNKLLGSCFPTQNNRHISLQNIPYIFLNFQDASFQYPLNIIDIPNNTDKNIRQSLLKCANLIILSSWSSEKQTKSYADSLKAAYKCPVKIYYRDQPQQKYNRKIEVSDIQYLPNLTNQLQQNQFIFDELMEELLEYIFGKLLKNNEDYNRVFNIFNQKSLKSTKLIRQKLPSIKKLQRQYSQQSLQPSEYNSSAQFPQYVQQLLNDMYMESDYIHTTYIRERLEQIQNKSIKNTQHLKNLHKFIQKQTKYLDPIEPLPEIITDKIKKYIYRIKLQSLNNLSDDIEDVQELINDKNPKKCLLQKISHRILINEQYIQPRILTLPKIIRNLQQHYQQKQINLLPSINTDNIYKYLKQSDYKNKKSVLISIPEKKQIDTEFFIRNNINLDKCFLVLAIISNDQINCSEIISKIFDCEISQQYQKIQKNYNNIEFQLMQAKIEGQQESECQNIIILKFADILKVLTDECSKQDREKAEKSLIFIMSVSDILIVLGNENRLLDNRELKKNVINCRNKIIAHEKMAKQEESEKGKKQKHKRIKTQTDSSATSIIYQICDRDNFTPNMKYEQDRVSNQMKIKSYKIFPMKMSKSNSSLLSGNSQEQLKQQSTASLTVSTIRHQNSSSEQMSEEAFPFSNVKTEFSQSLKQFEESSEILESLLADARKIPKKQQQQNKNIMKKMSERVHVVSQIQKIVPKKQSIIETNQQKISIIPESNQNVGQIIFYVEQNIQNEGKSKYQEFKKKTNNTYNGLDQMMRENFYMTSRICQKMLNEKLTPERKAKSDELYGKIVEGSKNGDDICIIMLVLKQIIEQNKQCELFFSEKSNARTQLTTKIFTTNYLNNFLKFEEVLQENQKINFKLLASDKQTLKKFVDEYKNGLVKQFGLIKDKIIVHRLIKGSIRVQWSYSDADVILQTQTQRVLVIHPFFRCFELSYQDFSTLGNRDFSQHSPDIERRGGWPYFMPAKGKRYGLNVMDKYDRGRNRWLQMSGKPGQWVVAFHGVACPFGDKSRELDSNQPTTLNKIFSGLSTGEMLKHFPTGIHHYKRTQCVNKQNVIVGQGVYLSPHSEVGLEYAYNNNLGGHTVNDKHYYLVMQCRINPQAIKVCQKQDYWVVNQSRDIRPYGILLYEAQSLTDEDISVDDDKIFKWQTYRDEILQFPNPQQHQEQEYDDDDDDDSNGDDDDDDDQNPLL